MEKKAKEGLNSYEYYEKELERVIWELEEGKIETLEDLIKNYEEGSTLVEKCETILKTAEMRILKIATPPSPSINQSETGLIEERLSQPNEKRNLNNE